MAKSPIIAVSVAVTVAFISQAQRPAASQTAPGPGPPLPGVVERSIAKLRNGDRAVRDEGAGELAAAGRSAVGPLTIVLSEQESAARTAATQTLALIGRPAVKALAQGLESPDPNHRRSCAQALRAIVCSPGMGPGSTVATDELLQMADKGPAAVRQRAIAIIGRICSDPAGCPLHVLSRGRDVLVGALNDRDPGVQREAVRSVGRIHSSLSGNQQAKVIRNLRSLLTSRDAELRGAAAWALHREDAATASMDLDSDAAVASLALLLVEGADDVSPTVAEQIARRGGEIAEAILRLMTADVAWDGSDQSVSALRRTGALAPGAMRQALESQDAAIRVAVASAVSAPDTQYSADLLGALRTAVGDEDGAVRLAAATSLGLAAEDFASLVGLLGDRYDYVRAGAAEALAVAGRPAIGPLVAALLSADPHVRRSAAATVGRIGDDRAVSPLLQLLRDPDAAVRVTVADALGLLRNDVAVEPLIEALADENASVRAAVAAALGAIGAPRGTDSLIGALSDTDQSVRTAAVASLGAIGLPPSGNGSSRAMEALLMAMRPESGICSPVDAAAALGRMGEAAVRPLMLLLRDTDPRVREAAIQGLGATRAIAAAQSLVGLLDDPDPRISRAAAAGILAFQAADGGPAAVGALIEGLGHEPANVRARSAALLGQMIDPTDESDVRRDGARALKAALADGSPVVRAAAATALGDLREADAVEELKTALTDDASYDVRRRAAAALQRIRTPAALDALRSTANPPGE